MKLHERDILFGNAKSEFLTSYYKEIEHMDLDCQTIIVSFSQSILNLRKKELIILNEHHQLLHDLVEEIDKKYRLTYAEWASILSHQITSYAKQAISFEHRENYDFPRGLQ